MTQERRTIPLAKHRSMAVNCPLAPPGHATVQARSLHRACLIVGGIDPLVNRLQVSKDILERWMRGEGEPPLPVFYAAVEIVLLYVDKTGTSM